MKTKSNKYKRRNLPENYSVIHTIKTKPVFAMFVFLIIGGIMVFSTNYKLIGAVFAIIGGHTLFIAKDKVSVEFSNDFMVVYLEDNEEECLNVDFFLCGHTHERSAKNRCIYCWNRNYALRTQ